MGRVLKHDVHVVHDRNQVTVLRAGDEVPEKFAALVVNEKAFVETAEDETTATAATEVAPAGAIVETTGGDDTTALVAPYDEKLSKDALVAELTRRELPTSGNKPELIARLEADDRDKAAGGPDDTEE
jgi:hypothetical protein